MAFNVTGLTNWTKANETTLITKSLFKAKTATLMTKLTGVKSSMQIPTLAKNVVFQAGGTCGFNASGDTTITSRNVTIGKISVQEQWCVKDLETKYTQLLLTNGAYYEALPGGIEAAIVDQTTGQIAESIETAIWQGDTGSGNVNLNKFDGLQTIIGAAAGVVNANVSTYITPVTAITSTNILSIVDAIYTAIPVAILDKEDLHLFMGNDVYRLYQLALKNANLFHYIANGDTDAVYTHPGTMLKIMPVNGLNGTSDLYVLRTSNMFLGVDLEGDEDRFKMWYSEDFDVVRFRSEFKYGVQIALPAEVVKFIV
jgi:hypothetical protein